MAPPNRHLHKMHDSFVVPEGNEFGDEFYERNLPPGAAEIKQILARTNEHFHEDYAVSFTKNVAEFLDRMYFRSRWVGFEELPKRNNPPCRSSTPATTRAWLSRGMRSSSRAGY